LFHYTKACDVNQSSRQFGYYLLNTSAKLPQTQGGQQRGPGLSRSINSQTNVNSRLAPTINVKLYSLNDSCHTNALPDFGADISAAGEPLLCLLNDHVHNFLPSEVIQQTANGWKMYPLGYLPVTFTIGFRQCTDKNHIYPNIPGTILSYKLSC